MTELEKKILAFCLADQRHGYLAEFCTLHDRDENGNKIPEYWRPNPGVVDLVRYAIEANPARRKPGNQPTERTP